MSGIISLYAEQDVDFEEFAPHYAIHSFSGYRQFNNYASLPDTDISVLSHMVESDMVEAYGSIVVH